MNENTKTEIENEIQANDIVLYMKGTPVFPQCGFSASTVGLLNHLGVKFSSVNVLENDDIRQGIKDLSLIHISSPRDATLSRMPSSA